MFYDINGRGDSLGSPRESPLDEWLRTIGRRFFPQPPGSGLKGQFFNTSRQHGLLPNAPSLDYAPSPGQGLSGDFREAAGKAGLMPFVPNVPSGQIDAARRQGLLPGWQDWA
jgi:hypothetical protein